MAIPYHLLPEQQPETALPHEFDQGIPSIWTKREKRLNRWTVYSEPAPPSNLTPRDLWGKRTPYFSNEEFRAVDALTRSGSACRPRKRKDRPAQNFRNVTEATMQSRIRRADAKEGHRPRTGQVAFTMQDNQRGREPVTKDEEGEYEVQVRNYPLGEKTAKRVCRGKERKREWKRMQEAEAGETVEGTPKKAKRAQRQAKAVYVSASGREKAWKEQKQEVKAKSLEQQTRVREETVYEAKALPRAPQEPTSDVVVEDEPSEIPRPDIELEDAED